MPFLLSPPDATTSAALYEWATLLVPVLGFAWLTLQKYLADARAQAAAVLAQEQVKRHVDDSNAATSKQIKDLQNTADSTHSLVNGGKSITLKLIAIQAAEIAALKNTPEAIECSRTAQFQYDRHQAELVKELQRRGPNAV